MEEIWLEVSNIALNEGHGTTGSGAKIQVQIKGNLDDDCWFDAPGTVESFKPLMDAMKEKRPIHAQLKAAGKNIAVKELRVSFAPSTTPR